MHEDYHVDLPTLEDGLDHIRQAPQDDGTVDLIVARPEVNERRILAEGELDSEEGLIGDGWKERSRAYTDDGSPDFETQINIMNSRVTALVAGDRERWPLAGDQLYIDFDLSEANVPAGTRLSIGEAILEITPPPHTGCKKFTQRYGLDAMNFVNSELGKQLHLRGVNARIVKSGKVRTGDRVRKVTEK